MTAGSYDLSIEATIGDTIRNYVIEVILTPCTLDYCLECNSDLTCNTWEYGYEPANNDLCDIIEPVDQSVSTTTQIAVGVTVTIGAITSLSSSGSTQSIFLPANQLQILMIISLDTPYKILEYLKSLNYYLFSFEFLQFQDLPILKNIYEYFDISGNKSVRLEYMGIENTSSAINNFSFTVLIWGMLMGHLCLFVAKRALDKSEGTNLWLKKVVTKVVDYVGLAPYITLIMESYVFLLVTPVFEIFYFEGRDDVSKVSYLVSIVFIMVSCLFVFGIILQWRKMKNYDLYTQSALELSENDRNEANKLTINYGPCSTLYNGLK